LWILGDRGGNRVGQLSCEPVDDVVHPNPSLRRRAGFRGAPQSVYTRAMSQDWAPDVFMFSEKF
jgi:hypothetical protein